MKKIVEEAEAEKEDTQKSKRFLKHQGFLEKMRMKMLNDASRTGWDKK